MPAVEADCVDQDQTARSVQSDLDLHCPIRSFVSLRHETFLPL